VRCKRRLDAGKTVFLAQYLSQGWLPAHISAKQKHFFHEFLVQIMSAKNKWDSSHELRDQRIGKNLHQQ
jgi:hypothetical protein